ncbi:MAG: hypothetical protein DBX91_09030 [Subdoligranulum variabile]|nr:MAG: hypothetical protein DBX91_09030 [Subdoligranulum variabile]
MTNQTAFYLLRNVLREGWGLSLHFFESPETDLTALDLGIRAQLQNSDQLYAQLRILARSLEFGKILVVRDQLHNDTVLLRAGTDTCAFFSIGPFRWASPDHTSLQALRAQTGLDMSQTDAIQHILRRVPVNLSRAIALSIAKNLLLSFYGLEDPVVTEYNLENITVSQLAPVEDINDRAHRVEEVYRHEEKLLAFIAEGNEPKALTESHFFVHTGMDQRLNDRLLSRRSLAYSTNTLFRKAAQSAGVHPLFCDEISEKFAQRLELCSTAQQIDRLHAEMIHDYCQLCRQQSTKGYSSNVQKVMQYIQLNLSQDLSPESIAQGVNFSSGYISRRFKSEVGVSLVGYIAARRVQVACQLLEKTRMTVREISNYVGIPDWNYFTKVFRKEKGCTPSQYRKQAHRKAE